MGVRFVIGRAGSGKSRHCLESIAAEMRRDPLGPPIYYILPKQATFQAERELTCQSGLIAFCRARVLSFELLGEEILANCGGAAMPEVSALGRQMLIGHLLRRHQDQLKFFKSAARQPGLAARLDKTFGEFERCGKDPDALAALVSDLKHPAGNAGAEHASQDDVETALLRDKVADFHLLFKAYRDVLGQERVDPHRRLEQVLACLHEFEPLKRASVFVDEFREFSQRERQMLLGLARVCPRVEITLLADPADASIRDVHHLPDDFDLFHLTTQTYRQLHLTFQAAGVVIEPPVMLSRSRRFENPALAAIERTMFDQDRGAGGVGVAGNGAGGGAAIELPAPEDVELVEAPDRRGEVDAAARRIRALLRAGLRLRDIGVLVRDLEEYHELITSSFREHDICFFADRRRIAAHHPLLQFTRAVFQIARQSWPHEAMMTLLKSGLAGLTPDEADQMENYVLLHRIHAGAWCDDAPWRFSRSLTRGRDDDELPPAERIEVERMDALRRKVARPLAAFADSFRGRGATPIRQTVVELFNLFQAFGVRETIARWIAQAKAANDLEQSGEHEQVWAELMSLFDQLVDLLGEQSVALADFVEILESGLEQFDLALAPPRVDQVLVGQVDRTRTPRWDTVFLLGLSEGQFPKIAREDSVLSDGERAALRRRDLDVDPDSERRLLDENLLGYIGFTCAGKRLVVTRAIASEDGKPLAPSPLWGRLRGMFSEVKLTQEKRESEAPPQAIGTPRQLVTSLMRWAREGGGLVNSDPRPALYQWLATHPCRGDMIDVMRFMAWRALGYCNEAKLSAQTAQKLYGSELHASASRIEAFATCPFRQFARYDLQLREREEQDVTAMDLGNVYHQILERCVREALEQRRDFCDLEPHLTRQMIVRFAEEVGRTLRGELMLSSARNKYLLDRVAKTLEQVCATQQEALRRGTLRPAMAELGFGVDGGALEALRLPTPRGNTVVLHGKIDRVDRGDDGEVAVIDYKMSDKKLTLAHVRHGLSLQLLTYLLVLEANGEKLFERDIKPAGAFYARLLRWLESVKHPDEATDPQQPEFHLSTKPRGIFDARFLGAFDSQLDSGASSVVQAYIKKDGTFGRPDSSDHADGAAFTALLRFVRRRIGELADELIVGNIAVRPYRMGNVSPCPNCEFRALCRFDAGVNHYLILPMMKRSAVLETLMQEDRPAAQRPGAQGGGDGA
jgi:ATP-dependent helicase/nuclease subunit B